MTRHEFYSTLAAQTGLSKNQVKQIFEQAYALVLKSLSKEGKIPLGHFGVIKIVDRKARMGRHPQTGKPLKIAAKRAVKMSLTSALKKSFLNKK